MSKSISENIGKLISSQRKFSQRFSDRKTLCDEAGISERTLAKMESGDSSVTLSRYLAVTNLLGLSWIFEVFGVVPSGEPKIKYLTGSTSLNLSLEGRDAPLWHNTYISNVRSWSISGVNFSSTMWLLGVEGLVLANDSLKMAGLSFDFNVYAASYERAIFDLLYEFCVVRDKPIPNIQATDVDDTVDFQKVMQWIDKSCLFIDHDKIEKMKQWLIKSDYDFNGTTEAA